jgi:hypothetical protein
MPKALIERYFATTLDNLSTEFLTSVVFLEGSRLTRLWGALTLRPRVALAKRRLVRQGASALRSFVAVPDLTIPVFIYELHSAASEYASQNLQLPTVGTHRLARIVLSKLMGCDPAAGAVVVIGHRA